MSDQIWPTEPVRPESKRGPRSLDSSAVERVRFAVTVLTALSTPRNERGSAAIHSVLEELASRDDLAEVVIAIADTANAWATGIASVSGTDAMARLRQLAAALAVVA